MKPFDFLLLAEWLIDNKKCPEGFRTAISRSYYDALHTALSFLEEMGIFVPNAANKHEKVPDVLDYTGDPAVEKAGDKLRSLREERNRADYKLADTHVEAEDFARAHQRDAESIIAILNTCRTGKDVAGSRYEQVKEAARQRADLLFRGIKP